MNRWPSNITKHIWKQDTMNDSKQSDSKEQTQTCKDLRHWNYQKWMINCLLCLGNKICLEYAKGERRKQEWDGRKTKLQNSKKKFFRNEKYNIRKLKSQ